MEQPAVGTKVIALRAMMGFPIGTIGYVYETYSIGSDLGVSIIFSNGSYDGFGESEWRFVEFKEVDQRYAQYEFKNVMQVWKDYRAGYWKFYE